MHFTTTAHLLVALVSMAGGAPCGEADLPQISLPYGTWQAARHDAQSDVYTFRNIRYAASPVGPLRFAQPAPPERVEGFQDGSYGFSCIQPIPDESVDDLVMGEDCLFLDVYAPGAGFKNKEADIPVIVWIHGGGFNSGAKTWIQSQGLFDGTGLTYQADGDAVVVVINYRLGVLGWLGGPSAQHANATNLGLHDQRAALQWVQDHIHLFGANASNVSVWGSSAGSGSIIHHLVQKGGRRDPLFHKAIIQSPGFATMWKPEDSEKLVQEISAQLGCPGGDFECLRSVNVSDIQALRVPVVSPVPDNDFFDRPAMLEFADGRYWRGLDSVVVSHTKVEGFPWSLFGLVRSEQDLTDWILATFGNSSALLQRIKAQYPATDATTPASRYETISNDIVFLCQGRIALNAYSGNAYAGVYSVGAALHAFDMYATFYNPTLGLEDPTFVGSPVLNDAHQAFLVSHARTGNVNSFRAPNISVEWPLVTDARAEMVLALESTDTGFRVISDPQATRSGCDFWLRIYRELWDGSDLGTPRP